MVCKSLYFQGFWALSASFWTNLGFTYYVIKNIFLLNIIRNKLISKGIIHHLYRKWVKRFFAFFRTYHVIPNIPRKSDRSTPFAPMPESHNM